MPPAFTFPTDELDTVNRWAGSLDTELLRVLGANLGAMLGTQRVVVYPDLAPYPLAYRILVSVERVEAGPAEEVTLNARWTIRRGDAGEAVAVGRTDVEQPTGSDDTDDLVAAHSAAVAALSRDIATRIDALRGR